MINELFEKWISSTSIKIFNNKNPAYINVFKQAGHLNILPKAFFHNLSQPLRKTNQGQNIIPYITFNIWDSLSATLKATMGLNNDKKRFKKVEK